MVWMLIWSHTKCPARQITPLPILPYDRQGCASFTLVHKGNPCRTGRASCTRYPQRINALAALATTMELGFDFKTASEGLAMFHGTDRRFQYKGEVNGVTIIDDYAHHPSEIRATLKAAANYPHREIWCVFQPHTYIPVPAHSCTNLRKHFPLPTM